MKEKNTYTSTTPSMSSATPKVPTTKPSSTKSPDTPVKTPIDKSEQKFIEFITQVIAWVVCFMIVYFTWTGAEYVFTDDVGLSIIDAGIAAVVANSIFRKINEIEKKIVSNK